MATMLTGSATKLLDALEQDGIALLPDFLSPEQLKRMRAAFEARLRHLRWNDVDGYERTERYRLMVQDVLTLEQGFVDVALHPLVTEALREYLGPDYELVEAKGWKSLPTRRDFHGWHGDAWYDQTRANDVHREVKLGLYLTDVRSGFFQYIKQSHRQHHPRGFTNEEVRRFPQSQIVAAKLNAGSAFLFDTSGIHRQSVPVLESRYAVFYNYHDPRIPLQKEDVDYYRYHPLLLNAAFLGGLSAEDRRVLGFGTQGNYIPAFRRQLRHPWLVTVYEAVYDRVLAWDDFRQRVGARVKRMFAA